MNNIEVLKYINLNSKYVSVNKQNIINFVETMSNFEYSHWLNNCNVNVSEKKMIIFVFLCESVNFCFWKNSEWVVEYESKYYKGSSALIYSLIKKLKDDTNFLAIDKLKSMNKAHFEKIFCSKDELPDLINKRYKLFKNTIKVLYKKGALFYKEIFSINSDIEMLNYIKTNFKYFNDQSGFKGKIIHFDKRAILLVNDLFNVSKTIRDNIKSVTNLTGGADYVLPKIFQENNILVYNNSLLNKIIHQLLIRHNSKMEIEIRGNTLYVLELIREYLKKNKGIDIASIELDNIIWKMKEEKWKNSLPVHHTKTIYY